MKPYYRVYSNESTAAEHVGTLEDAEARAKELAAKHPGRAFEILKCIATTQIVNPTPSTFWMDGEEPPEKPRYRMLEEGEIITCDDEFEHPEGWRKYGERHNSIGDAFCKLWHLPHRRPL